MKKAVGIIIFLFGLALGFYVGFMVFAIGVANIVDAVKDDPTDKGKLAWGLFEVVFLAETAGVLASIIPFFISVLCFDSADRGHAHVKWETKYRRTSARQVEKDWQTKDTWMG